MQCGLFGKLPAKRDFVSYNMPRPFLDQWETWMQATLAESRHAVGEQWKDIFLTLPIWRFWCGSSVFGRGVTGAIMASVDGVGRYFPLSICACATSEQSPLPPLTQGLSDWLDQCENALLGMLDERIQFDPVQILDQLGHPPARRQATQNWFPPGTTVWTGPGTSIASAFENMAAIDETLCLNERGIWWTLGGPGHDEQMITTMGPVADNFFTTLMIGKVSI
jgi:type VI secretion system protein ImpM